jgi:phosphohistidine phosphatase
MASDQKHQLLIMRHAKSDWGAEYKIDFDRPLSKRGVKNADAMGGWLLGKRLVPDRVISSPATRAKQTVNLVLKRLGQEKESIIWDERIYEAGLGDLLNVVESHCKGANRILLVGHNPGLDRLVMYLAENQPPITASGKLMTTAAIAVFDYRDDGIVTIDKSALLVELKRPKELPGNG